MKFPQEIIEMAGGKPIVTRLIAENDVLASEHTIDGLGWTVRDDANELAAWSPEYFQEIEEQQERDDQMAFLSHIE